MNITDGLDMEKIQRLVGTIEKEHLHHVDCYVGENVGIFVPVTGPCYYAVTPLHTHPAYMFVLTFNDQTALKIGGQIIVQKQGELSALSPGIAHHEIFSEQPPRYAAVFINKDFFEAELSQYPVGRAKVFYGESYEPLPLMLPTLKEFMLEIDNKIPGYESLIHAMSLKICHTIIRSLFKFEYKQDKVSSRLEIDKTIEYMHSNLSKKIKVEELAKAAGMSPSHYAKLFKNETGFSCINYLNQIRLEKARKMLLKDNLPITQVALECGFGSPSYLSACFFKQHGISPSDYQKEFNKHSISK